ncbi:MAG: hypothetical protein FWG70_01360 [Oscillospiraceae bacterium]|nr:hypothetical protein [Oscillospiraceae bacterium]
MFGFLKRKKKVSEEFTMPLASSDVEPLEVEDNGYFLSDRDIKIIVSSCVFLAKSNQYVEKEEIIAQIPEIGGKLRDKTDLSPDDITVISICLQAYHAEVTRLIAENSQSPLADRLRDEKVYFLVIIEKLTKYLTCPL